MHTDFFFHPALIFFLGMCVLPFLRGITQKIFMLAVPATAVALVGMLPSHGSFWHCQCGDFSLVFGRIDRMSMVFANVFTIMAIIGTIYGLHLKDYRQHLAAWGYVGSALGCVFAGDYLTLFLFWEGLMITSVCLVWMRRTKESINAGFRYFLVHTAGGLSLLAGIFLLYFSTGDLSFTAIDPDNANLAAYLILAGFLLNAAVPPLHAWLPDAYGSATVVGSVFMCAYTTKTAVYTLARAFAGFDILVPLGVIMALYGVVYAVLENDARRLLSYHIISQVGYMVAGIGIGTAMAINGACAHAYAHILYKALLFMGVGAVLEVTGRSKFSELGGLWKYMPWSFVFTLVGGLSISAFPLFSGFVSKSMVVAGAWQSHIMWAALGLTLASAGTFLHTGLKVPYFIWFWKKEPPFEPPKGEAPFNMLVAMGIAAFMCIFLGVCPQALYNMLPYPVDYHPYTPTHIMESYQILLFTMLGFFLLVKKLSPEPLIGLDLDWFYRKGAGIFMAFCRNVLARVEKGFVMDLHDKFVLPALAVFASFSYWHDRRVVDGIIDGSACKTMILGNYLRGVMQPGIISRYLAAMLTVIAAAVFLTVVLT
ncbi:MAG TPA: Na(+)/H(+) antiporter subunit D [Thermodesulfobacteriaceae bacterium]|nr:Na(+)/H(+) antiporter subunit D [Thermodesulfobacteriaceae bacterium]